jgi:hypothetical protein
MRLRALSRERRSGSRTSRSLPAADPRPERQHTKKEREKNGTSGAHGGGYFAPHDTDCQLHRGAENVKGQTNQAGRATWSTLVCDCWALRENAATRIMEYSSTYGRPITYLMGGSLVEVHSSSYFCLSHARTAFSCGAPCCNPAHRPGAAWALVVELGPAPPRCPCES